MEKKETVLIKVSYLVELTENELTREDDVLDKITTKIGKDEKIIVEGKEFDISWNTTSSFMLDTDTSNCGKCANCGAWVTDREKPNHISELCNGAIVDGKLLCDECLPADHRWAF